MKSCKDCPIVEKWKGKLYCSHIDAYPDEDKPICSEMSNLYTLKDIENAINETIRLKFDANTKIANFVNFGSENSWLSNDEIKSEVLKIYIK